MKGKGDRRRRRLLVPHQWRDRSRDSSLVQLWSLCSAWLCSAVLGWAVLDWGPWGSAFHFFPMVDLHRLALQAYGREGGKPLLCVVVLSNIKQAILKTFCLHRAERRCSHSQKHVFVRAVDYKTPVTTASPLVKILSTWPLFPLSSCLVFQLWKAMRIRDLTPLTRHLQHGFFGGTRLSVPLLKVLITDV